MENIAIYMRLSKEDEYIKDESNSITSQKIMLLNYVSTDEELKGNKILQFVDDGYSGTNLNRPGMQDMLKRVKEIRADGFYYRERKHESHVLKGKVFCGGCGKRMAHSYQGRPKYICNTRYYGSGYVVGEEAGVDATV